MKHKPQYRFAWMIIMASVCLVITAVLSSCDSKNHTSEKASGTYAEFVVFVDDRAVIIEKGIPAKDITTKWEGAGVKEVIISKWDDREERRTVTRIIGKNVTTLEQWK